ncbi:hypothetical protein D9757_012351 [Collybiopsis confluens]|uniref:3'-5' exonuclease n=1 Tax=Collybiopsis confluens TaxID=2823264 RepID=A0A8H5G3G9_9AGAR|nr:hypothetical protein D9757_012351 [Collybiopsis confluens]
MFFIFRATRFLGRYLRSLTEIQGFRYFTSSSVQPNRLSISDEASAAPSSSKFETEPENPPAPPVFKLPQSFKVKVVQRPEYIDKALKPLVDFLDQDPDALLYLSLDAEWNISRRTGVSILQLCPHFDSEVVHRLTELPPLLLRLLTSPRVWKIGSRIKGDLTRLRRQFPYQLDDTVSFSTIDLKDYAISKGIIKQKQTASLAALCETVLGVHLPKDTQVRVNNSWEYDAISPKLLHYAACDVVASKQIFEKMSGETEEESMEEVSEGAVEVVEVNQSVELYA